VRAVDIAREGLTALRYRRLRALLCALGIALGIASVVAILAIPASAQAALLDRLGKDGNLLTVATGRSFNGQAQPLPPAAPQMLGRISGVDEMAAVGQLPTATVRRTAAIPPANTGGIAVLTATPTLVRTLDLSVVSGRFLDAATGRYPVVVLGAGAARTLGISRVTPQTQVFLGTADNPGGQYAVVLGILAPVPLAPELDTAALLGTRVATDLLAFDGAPTRVYLRADPDRVPAVQALLASTANPEDPSAVSVGRPSDLLVARVTARGSLTALALALGGVALLIGGVGVANVMVLSVLERRGEIGLRRALGATRIAIASLFLAESTVLCLLGAVTGAGLGIAATLGYAAATGTPVVLPATPIVAGLAAALVVGLTAGLYPATRAARLSPTDALRTA
jgi:putative ABC transport system permease protein